MTFKRLKENIRCSNRSNRINYTLAIEEVSRKREESPLNKEIYSRTQVAYIPVWYFKLLTGNLPKQRNNVMMVGIVFITRNLYVKDGYFSN